MFKKGTKFYSILKGKCPKCNLKYMLEPSFYYGAMYVNYGITVAVSIVTFLIAKLGFNLNLLQSLFTVFGSLFILAPINLRLARIIWINMFVNYEK